MAKDVRIRIPPALEHQEGPLSDPARFKAWRWGRRAGKTAGQFIAASVGHGAPSSEVQPWPGFLMGGKIFWISRDNTQMKVVWRRDIKPRFKGRPFMRVNEQELFVEAEFDGGGFLDLRSFENIDSLRGEDADIVIFDEAAHYDLEYAWKKIVRPMLVDRRGSAIFSSTTKLGSWFNELCELIRAGGLPDYWREWYATAFDNPVLDKTEVEAMIADYPEGSADLEQEVYAKLIAGGGLAFSEWADDVHVLAFEPPDSWGAVGCLDWGYSSAGWFGYARTGFDEETHFRWERYFSEVPPYDLGYELGLRMLQGKVPEFIVADSAMWQRQQSEITIAEHFERGMGEAMKGLAPPLIQSPKGPQSRATRKILMHEALKWKDDDDHTRPLPTWLRPKLTFHPDCHHAIRTIPKLPVDEKDTEKVQTHGVEDHPYDGISYLLSIRTPPTERPESFDDDVHPGFDKSGRRKKPWQRKWQPDPATGSTWMEPEEAAWH